MSAVCSKETLLLGLNRLRNQEKLTDVTLIAEGRRFKAHRAVLAASSDYFCAMFADCAMSETRKDDISLYGVTAVGIGAILDYIYTSKLELNLDNIEEMLAASTYVQVKDVIEQCTKFLNDRIDMENCLSIAALAEIYGQPALCQRAYRFICAHFKEFSGTTDFTEANVDQMRTILSSNYPIDVSEQELVRLLCIHAIKQKWNSSLLREFARLINWQYITYEQLKSLRHVDYSLNGNKHLPSGYFYGLTKEFLDKCGDLNEDAKAVQIEKLGKGPVNMRGMELCLLNVGGFDNNGLSNEIMCFSSAHRKWYTLTKVPHVEQCNFGTAVLNNQLFIVGGAYNVGLREVSHPYCFRYCPIHDAWLAVAPLQLDRCRFSLNAVGQRYLYAIGGIEDNLQHVDAPSNVERYDFEKNCWEFMPYLYETRSQHAGTVVGDKLYISGGIYMADILESMWCLDTKNHVWEKLAPMPTPCCDHVMIAIDNRIYSCGGWLESVDETRTITKNIFVYDIETNSWSFETRIPNPKFYSGITNHGYIIYFIGGLDSTKFIDRTSSETMAYDVQKKIWLDSKDWNTPTDIWESSCETIYVPALDN